MIISYILKRDIPELSLKKGMVFRPISALSGDAFKAQVTAIPEVRWQNGGIFLSYESVSNDSLFYAVADDKLSGTGETTGTQEENTLRKFAVSPSVLDALTGLPGKKIRDWKCSRCGAYSEERLPCQNCGKRRRGELVEELV